MSTKGKLLIIILLIIILLIITSGSQLYQVALLIIILVLTLPMIDFFTWPPSVPKIERFVTTRESINDRETPGLQAFGYCGDPDFVGDPHGISH